MKAISSAVAILLLCLVTVEALAQVRVRGYTRKDGTYVAPHYRSSPNSSKSDNYSTRGNYNPYTGKKGSVDPYALPSYSAPRYSTTPTYSPPPATHYAPPPPPVNRWWANPRPQPEREIVDAATESRIKEELIALSVRLEATDPFYSVRMPELLKQASNIRESYPPESLVAEVERIYWEIPATKSYRSNAYASVIPTSPIAMAGGYSAPTCRRLADTRESLASAARSLLNCAEARDYSDDCGMESSETRDAAEDYQAAVSEASGICE